MAHEPPHTSSPAGLATGEVAGLRTGTLDRWLSHPWENGVQVDTLEDLQALRVETVNNTYDLAIVSGQKGAILVRGGRYFPEWTAVQFVGCSLGGGLLKRYGVHVGFRMEFYSDGRLIITSPVRAINLAPEARCDLIAPVETAPLSSATPAV